MPVLQFDICTPRTARTFELKGKDGKLTFRRRIEYEVELSWDDGSTDFSTVSEPEVISAPGLPLVNYSVYEFNGKIIPYLQCTSKKATQTKRLSRWRVACDFDSQPQEGGEGDQQPQAPADPQDIAPKVESSSETIDRIAYTDISGDPILTPTGNFFQTPMTRPVTLTVLTITQYETGWTDDLVAARNGRANSGTYRGKAAHTWRIFSVSAKPTQVNGIDCHQVQYVLKHNPLPEGWKETRALIDTHHLKSVSVGGTPKMKKFPFLDTLGQPTTGWLNADGTIRPRSQGLEFKEVKVLEEIAFSFLPNTA